MSVYWPEHKLLKPVVCANLTCEQLATAIVTDRTALCGDHALEWYMHERRRVPA